MSGVDVDETVVNAQLRETHSFSHKVVEMPDTHRVAIQRESVKLCLQDRVARENAETAPDSETEMIKSKFSGRRTNKKFE